MSSRFRKMMGKRGAKNTPTDPGDLDGQTATDDNISNPVTPVRKGSDARHELSDVPPPPANQLRANQDHSRKVSPSKTLLDRYKERTASSATSSPPTIKIPAAPPRHNSDSESPKGTAHESDFEHNTPPLANAEKTLRGQGKSRSEPEASSKDNTQIRFNLADSTKADEDMKRVRSEENTGPEKQQKRRESQQHRFTRSHTRRTERADSQQNGSINNIVAKGSVSKDSTNGHKKAGAKKEDLKADGADALGDDKDANQLEKYSDKVDGVGADSNQVLGSAADIPAGLAIRKAHALRTPSPAAPSPAKGEGEPERPHTPSPATPTDRPTTPPREDDASPPIPPKSPRRGEGKSGNEDDSSPPIPPRSPRREQVKLRNEDTQKEPGKEEEDPQKEPAPKPKRKQKWSFNNKPVSPQPLDEEPVPTMKDSPVAVRPPLYDETKTPSQQWESDLGSNSRPPYSWAHTKRWTCCRCQGHTIVEQTVCSRIKCMHDRCPSKCRLESLNRPQRSSLSK